MLNNHTIARLEYRIRAGKARRTARARVYLLVNSGAFNPHDARHAALAANTLRRAYRAAMRAPS